MKIKSLSIGNAVRVRSALLLAAAAGVVGCQTPVATSSASSSDFRSLPGTAKHLVTVADLQAAEKLVASYDQQPPFSFKYGGEASATLLPRWNPKVETHTLDSNRVQRTVTWKEGVKGLVVRLVSVRYTDFPAVEWTVYLKNEGSRDTKRVDDLRGIDGVIGHAVQTHQQADRPTYTLAAPQSATGGTFELHRGWVNAYQPLAQGVNRFDTAGNAPWISADSKDQSALLFSPAVGIEGATEAAGSGKSPAVSFKAPESGVYRISGSVAMTTNTGDGVEWVLHNDGGTVLQSANLDAGKSQQFENTQFLNAGQRIYLTMNARANAEGDIARVKFTATQMSKPGDGDITIHAEKGSDATENDYAPLPIALAAEQSYSLTSVGGRGSDGPAIPYFNVEMPDVSACIAIGWPGQWNATFQRAGNEVRLNAGQENVHTVLRPGEEIRTPLMAVVPYTGKDTQRGQNIWRQWMIAHNMPRVDGKLVGPFLAAGSSHVFNEMTRADEVNQITMIDTHLRRHLQINYWWMDAGWYEKPTVGWEGVGTWKPDTRRFPKGFGPISDYAHKKGVDTIVWFEPERVAPGTELYREHPQFLLSLPTDMSSASAGMKFRFPADKDDPNVAFNPTDKPRNATDGPITWQPGQFAMHPGKAEFSVSRYTLPADGSYHINAKFGMVDQRATTDVHVIFNGQSLLAGEISPNGEHEHACDTTITGKRGQTIDFVVGYGANKDYTCDATLATATIQGPGGISTDISAGLAGLPTQGDWTYGEFPQGDPTHPASFTPFNRDVTLGEPNNGWKLLNLGNPQAREWLTNRVDSLIKSFGISVYRQDFNIAPLPYWRNADTADRQGMTENLYVQGYLAYWDALRERNPKIYIDSCASGGRRNDLETMRRSTPFLRSDYCFFPIGQQSHTYGISQWLPLNGTGIEVGDSALSPAWKFNVDPYVFRSDMAPIDTLALDIHNGKYDWKKFAEYIRQYQQVMPAYLGDYYPLTESTLDPAKWIAWQFYLPQKNEGFIQAFRREKVAEVSCKLKLFGLDRNAMYELIDVDHPQQARTVRGAELLDAGLNVTVDQQPGAALIRIKRSAAK